MPIGWLRRCGGVLDRPAAAIVSCLPLRTRPERHRLALLADAFGLLRPGGPFVQFTYGIASPMPRRLGSGPHFRSEVSPAVWLNLPPARVWVYRAEPAPAPEAAFVMKLKTGPQLLGEELREQGGKLRHGLRSGARKARLELLACAEHVKSSLTGRAWIWTGRIGATPTGPFPWRRRVVADSAKAASKLCLGMRFALRRLSFRHIARTGHSINETVHGRP